MSLISAARPAWRSLRADTRAFWSATSFLSAAWCRLGVVQSSPRTVRGADGRAEQATTRGSGGRTPTGRPRRDEHAGSGTGSTSRWVRCGPFRGGSCGELPGRRHRASKLRWSALRLGPWRGATVSPPVPPSVDGHMPQDDDRVPAPGHDTAEGKPTARTSLDGLQAQYQIGSMVRGGTGTCGAVWCGWPPCAPGRTAHSGADEHRPQRPDDEERPERHVRLPPDPPRRAGARAARRPARSRPKIVPPSAARHRAAARPRPAA